VNQGVITTIDLAHDTWDTPRRQLSNPCISRNPSTRPPTSAREAANQIAAASATCDDFTRLGRQQRNELGAVDSATCSTTVTVPWAPPETDKIRIDVFTDAAHLKSATKTLSRETYSACHWWTIRSDHGRAVLNLSVQLGCTMISPN
jgi:hypothetical protein